MELGMIGLGKMGANMTTRLLRGGHKVVAFDFNKDAVKAAVGDGATGASSLEELVGKLSAPRIAWMMVPSGAPTEQTMENLLKAMKPGDIIIDGGNSNWKDSIRRAGICKGKGVAFLDAGTSGGIWGLENGYCLMVGGENASVKTCEPIFTTLAPKDGYAHVGDVGAGHFSKMVHNGIEYGLLQAYGEGFEILEKSQFKYDLHKLAKLWLSGSVVRSWLLELLEIALRDDPNTRRHQRLRRRFGRGPLDGSGRDRRGCPGAGDYLIADGALCVAARRIVQRQDYCSTTQSIRRTRGHARRARSAARRRRTGEGIMARYRSAAQELERRQSAARGLVDESYQGSVQRHLLRRQRRSDEAHADAGDVQSAARRRACPPTTASSDSRARNGTTTASARR